MEPEISRLKGGLIYVSVSGESNGLKFPFPSPKIIIVNIMAVVMV